MVVDANAIAMIAVVRSLGKAGYRPHAVAPTSDALGFKSSFAVRREMHPAYGSHELIDWLKSYVVDHNIRAIVCGEEFLQSIGPEYAEFTSLVPDSASAKVRELCLSKAHVWTQLSSDALTSRHLPNSGTFENANAANAFVQHVSDSVYYLKVDRTQARHAGCASHVTRVRGPEEIRKVALAKLQDYSTVSWQQHVAGEQVGVSLWCHKGRVVAENMVRGLHLYPYYAGNMSLRETWWHDGILADAKMKLAALGWTGVAMMEYIWSPRSGEFWFIELNPRFWGYLHLDLACGKDFPKWQIDAHLEGRQVFSSGRPACNKIMRYAPGEVIHVASRCLSKNLPATAKVKSVFEFLVLSLKPGIAADLWYPGDRILYIHGWIRFIRDLPGRIAKMFGREWQ